MDRHQSNSCANQVELCAGVSLVVRGLFLAGVLAARLISQNATFKTNWPRNHRVFAAHLMGGSQSLIYLIYQPSLGWRSFAYGNSAVARS